MNWGPGIGSTAAQAWHLVGAPPGQTGTHRAYSHGSVNDCHNVLSRGHRWGIKGTPQELSCPCTRLHASLSHTYRHRDGDEVTHSRSRGQQQMAQPGSIPTCDSEVLAERALGVKADRSSGRAESEKVPAPFTARVTCLTDLVHTFSTREADSAPVYASEPENYF